MPCKNKTAEDCENIIENCGAENFSDIFTVEEEIDTKNLEEKGRIQYFYHSPSSKLPVRDILNEHGKEHKTEPHIEIGAENYISCCYQSNIKNFVKSNEKYLFLVTTCRNKNKNKELNEKTDEKKTNQFIVGYIIKEKAFDTGGHICIRGSTFIYSFDDSIPVKDICGKNFSRSENKGKTLSLSRDVFVDNQKTERILKHFDKKTNIFSKCIEEIKKLDARNPKKEDKTCLVLRGKKCSFQNNGCLRWSVK